MKHWFWFLGAVVILFFVGSCTEPINPPAPNGDDITTEDGLVIVRIPLPAANGRAVTEVLEDRFKPSQINYYEAVMKVNGAQEYFVGTARVGVSYLSIAVVPDKEYDVLVLCGVDTGGEKILLGSGFANNGGAGILVRSGQRTIIPVPMKLHTVTVGMYDDTAPASAEKMFPIIEKNGVSHVQVWNIGNADGTGYQHDFFYHADVTGIEALAAAEGGSVTTFNHQIEPTLVFGTPAVSTPPPPPLRF